MNAQTRFERDRLQHPPESASPAADARSWWRSIGTGAQAANHSARPAAASWREGLQASLLHGMRFRAALPVVLQTEAAECGLASLAMVLAYHGTSTDLVSLRRRHAISMSGITLTHLVDIAAQEHLASRAVRLELSELAGLKLPCILHWDLSHFVVLESVTGTNAVVIDPARGRRVMPLVEIGRHFTGVALELWPEPDFQPRKEKVRVTITQLAGRFRGLGGAGAQLLALSVVLELLSLLHPQLMQWLADHVIIARDFDLLYTMVAGLVVVAVLQQGFSLTRSWMLTALSASLKLQWRSNIFTHLLRLPASYFQKRHLGDIVSRFESVDSIQSTLTSAALEAILDGLMAVVALCLMYMYSPELTFIALGAVSVYGLLRLVLHTPLVRAREEEIIRAASQSSHLLESIRGIRTIKLFTREAERRGTWQTLLTAELNAGIRLSALRLAYGTVRTGIGTAAEVAVLALGAMAVLDNRLSLGMLLAFAAYRSQFHQRTVELIGKLFDIRMLRLDAQRLSDIVLTEPEPVGGRGPNAGAHPALASTDIDIRSLQFRYADHEPLVINGIDLHIPQGQSVAIVGPSGGGKSSLVSLLMGEQTPLAGSISIGGQPLAAIDRRLWRRAFGSVLQDDSLFAGTLAENISFFDPDVDLNRVVHCAALAAVWDDIQHMPMGLHTLVGDMGTTLSGGQKQRVLLARALYKRPRVLILDEATSALDPVKEREVNAAIDSLGITKIMVAHRLETIMSAQRVVAIDRGQVVFDGRPSEYVLKLRDGRAASG